MRGLGLLRRQTITVAPHTETLSCTVSMPYSVQTLLDSKGVLGLRLKFSFHPKPPNARHWGLGLEV